MNKILLAFIFASFIFVHTSCDQKINPHPALIPLPLDVEMMPGQFKLDTNSKVYFTNSSDNSEIEDMQSRLQNFISKQLIEHTQVEYGSGTPMFFTKHINLVLEEDQEFDHDEAYELEIKNTKIKIRSSSETGLARGVQTLRQLCDLKSADSQSIPNLKISDKPKYEYRGTMLDISRHFFGPEIIKTHIDRIAQYKINHLHLHLSDDQGWRIEIKGWPKLTSIGAQTEVGGGEGGFLTQEEYMDIVDYAKLNYITIVPEIDMPGHTNAALASYAFLNCDNTLRELYTGTNVGFSTFCTRKDSTYIFIDQVIEELTAMTPGPYIHIGGDESDVTEKEDYKYFVKRVEGIVQKHGKQMMGWADIADANLDSTSVAQLWHSEENGKKAQSQNMKIVFSLASRSYLDMKYDSTTELGLQWAGLIEVDHAYDWQPDTLFESINAESIIGIECPLWTETVVVEDDIEYLVFPRLLAYAEIGWTQSDRRVTKEFLERLAKQSRIMKSQDINFYQSSKVNWED